MQRVAELERAVADDEAQVDFFVDRHDGPEAVGFHAHTGDDHSSVERRRGNDAIDDAGDADALEHDRTFRFGGADCAETADHEMPGNGKLLEFLHRGQTTGCIGGDGSHVAAILERIVWRIVGRIDHDGRTACRGERPATSREIASHDGLDAAGLEQADDRETDRPTTDHDGGVLLRDLGPVDCMVTDCHRLGQHRDVR